MTGQFHTILVTGAAGFIGFHISKKLLEMGKTIVGVDCINDYYDIHLKQDRLKQLQSYDRFKFFKTDLSEQEELDSIFKGQPVDVVVNLAAQAGVRYSIENPHAYVNSNLVGFANVLECCRHNKVKHLVFASSSSVYGANTKMPFSVHHNVDHPVSLYAATKKSNELMAHAYSHLYDLPCTGLRFFTVYGPWGRPDMALFKFTKAILEDQAIEIYNHGKMKRDFTYIDDIVEAMVRIVDTVPESNPNWSGDAPDPGTSYARYRIFNIGNNNPVELEEFIRQIERVLNKKAIRDYQEMKPGDVPNTYADVDALMGTFEFKPDTAISKGIYEFVNWYKSYYQIG